MQTKSQPVPLILVLVLCAACAFAIGNAACASRPLVPTNVPEWAELTVRVIGRGAYPPTVSGPQARLMAERAARADAYRQLTEQVYGLELSTATLVRDAVLVDDVVETAVNGFIRGAQVIATRDRPAAGFVEMEMELFLGQEFLQIVFH